MESGLPVMRLVNISDVCYLQCPMKDRAHGYMVVTHRYYGYGDTLQGKFTQIQQFCHRLLDLVITNIYEKQNITGKYGKK